MQTFLPYSDFSLTAKVLDRQRLGKQRVETLQILKALKKGEWYCLSCNKPVTHFNPEKTGYHCYDCEAPIKKTAWYNHPAIQMWKGFESGLMLYLREMCREWVNRGYKDTCWEKAQEIGFRIKPMVLPNWIGNEEFHLSHKSNLLRKDPEYYKQYFADIPDNLPYFWPNKI